MIGEGENREELKSLGYANSWQGTPAIVQNCKHPREAKNEGRCLNRYTCKLCGFAFLVDSSD